MELAGKVIAVLEPRGGVSKSGNEWKVQEYVIETHDQYPRRMCFDVFGADKIQQFNIQVGEELNYILQRNSEAWLNGYQISYELLIINALFTFLGLCLFIKRQDKETSYTTHTTKQKVK